MQNYPKTEHYQVGEKVLALLESVKDTDGGGAEVVLSRSSPEFVRQLMMQEVPEINEGIVNIINIVRDAGYRTKMTVTSQEQKIDPVGACVGMRGIRVKNVVRELNNEKVDIIPHSTDPVELLQSALAPIEIRKISVSNNDKTISIVVDDDDFAAVIGKRGMNARLNGQLIGYNLEVQKMNDYRMTRTLQRAELAESDDATLDIPLTDIPGINHLIFDQLSAEFPTARSLLRASLDQLTAIPGISLDMADKILETVTKERINRLG
jgi:N utilization substance protein A